MPTPREIALEKNDSSMFADPEVGYDSEAGCPTAVAGHAAERSYAANPVNPPEPAPPCKNMKR
jgi:hypothetical protein